MAADPDRDTIAVVNLTTNALTANIALQPHDEPGRLVADAAGHVHVILRRGGALVTIDPVAGTILARRTACPIPRGVAYDPATDLVHVACMGGELVSFPAAGGAATRTLQLPRDLRDVVVDGDTLLVSQFRSAQVLVVDGNGNVTSTIVLPIYGDPSARLGDTFTAFDGLADARSTGRRRGPAAPARHHRHGDGRRKRDTRGPAGRRRGLERLRVERSLCGPGPSRAHPDHAGHVPADHAAHSGDGASGRLRDLQRRQHGGGGGRGQRPQPVRPVVVRLELRGSHGPRPLQLLSRRRPRPDNPFATMVDLVACPAPTAPPVTCPQPRGEAESVGFDGTNRIIVQTREPATIQIPEAGVIISLSDVSRADVGHEIFHANTGNGIACASCHMEGQEDGRTWNFDTEGPRRTMTVAGGISGRAPYHWDGGLASFSDLVTTVYNQRMGGPVLPADQVTATQSWMNAIPRLPGVVSDADAVTRGQAVFTDSTHGCAVCHIGAQLTNNRTGLDVGTGGTFKVPSLVGLAYTAPYLHDGCAATLADRFGSCGGGDLHGVTSTLTPDQLSDLIAYLDSL